MEMSTPSSPEPRQSFSSGRRWLFRLNLLLGVVALAALLLMVNYLSGGHYARFSVDSARTDRLSPQTLRVLERLTNEVKITIFFDPVAEADLYSLTTSLLEEYKHANPANISVQTLNYTRYDSEARQLLARLKLSGLEEKNFVIFECAGHTKICYAKSLSEYDYSGMLSGTSREVSRNAFRGEMLFTAAIFSVTHPETLKTCFLTGHGEHNPFESGLGVGYSKFAAIVKEELNSDWQPISLLGTNPIPSDCQLLVIAGPRLSGLLPIEIDRIDGFLKKGGGRLFVMLNNQYTNSGVEALLAQWGVEAVNDRVLERDDNYARSADGSDFLNERFGLHPVVDAIRNDGLQLRFNAPRPFKVASSAQTPGAPVVTGLATTSTNAVLEHEPSKPSRFFLAVAVEQGVIRGVNAPNGGTRILVTGDSTMFSNQRLDPGGNHMFASLGLTWLMERPDYLLDGLAPRPTKEYKLFLTQSQKFVVKLLFGVGLPGAILFIGGLVWLRRRS
jgi:hypothetical protein